VRQRDRLGFRRHQHFGRQSLQLLGECLGSGLHQFGITQNVQDGDAHTGLDLEFGQFAVNTSDFDGMSFAT